MSVSVKKKAAVLAAGAVVTAAVGTASLPDSAQDLIDASNALYAKSEEQGMALPDKPGLWDVITGLDGMVPTVGTEMSLKVSEAGDVAAGDALTLCHQLTAGEATDLVDGTLLAVDTATYEGKTYAAVVFNRIVDGAPYAFLGAVELADGTATVGDVVGVSSGALPEADVAILPATGVVVAVYPKDVRAMSYSAQIGAGATLTELGWGKVVEDGSPYNIRIAAEAAGFAISCVRTVAGVPTLSVVEGCQMLPETGLGYTPAVDMTADAFPVLAGCSFDLAPAPERWDLAMSCNYQEVLTLENIRDNIVLYLSCPKADDKGQYVVPVRMAADTWMEPTGYTDQGVDWAVSGPTAVSAGWGDGESLCHVVTVGRHEKRGMAWATGTFYIMGVGESIPQTLVADSTAPQTVQNVMEVGGALGTPGAVSIAADGKLYVTPCELGGDATGPTVTAAEDVVRGVAIASKGNTVWCITQGEDGWIRLIPLTAEKVVRKANPGDIVDGTAIQGGKPGEMCRASITRPLDDIYFAPDEGGDAPA